MKLLTIEPPIPSPQHQLEMVDNDADGRFDPKRHDAMAIWVPRPSGGVLVWLFRMKSRPDVDILAECEKRGGFGHKKCGLFAADEPPGDVLEELARPVPSQMAVLDTSEPVPAELLEMAKLVGPDEEMADLSENGPVLPP